MPTRPIRVLNYRNLLFLKHPYVLDSNGAGKKYNIIFLWKAKTVAFFSVPRAVRYSPRASGLPLPSRLSIRVPAKNSENHAV